MKSKRCVICDKLLMTDFGNMHFECQRDLSDEELRKMVK